MKFFGVRGTNDFQVREALALSYDSHSGQDRKSGEPYITHPVEVTRILAELKMDYESLIAGLLHDTVEDTDFVSFEEIGVSVKSNPVSADENSTAVEFEFSFQHQLRSIVSESDTLRPEQLHCPLLYFCVYVDNLQYVHICL